MLTDRPVLGVGSHRGMKHNGLCPWARGLEKGTRLRCQDASKGGRGAQAKSRVLPSRVLPSRVLPVPHKAANVRTLLLQRGLGGRDPEGLWRRIWSCQDVPGTWAVGLDAPSCLPVQAL